MSTSYTVPGTVGGGILSGRVILDLKQLIQNDELQFYTLPVVIGDPSTVITQWWQILPTAPGSNDPYWSITPPPSDRYRGFWGKRFRGAIAIYPESPITWWGRGGI